MNIERIKSFTNQAMAEPPYDGSADRWGLFAKLIIQKCIDIAYMHNNAGEGGVIAFAIEEHFGIKERE